MAVPTLAVYVSGHGYGHSTRTAEVLRQVRARHPALPIAVVTATPARLFRRAVGSHLLVRNERADVGLVQRDALVIDVEATLAAWEEFQGKAAEWVAREAAWLRESGARLVLADIPPLAFAAASAAGLPAVGLTNFSWDWVYRHLARHAPGLARAAETAADAYATAALLLELPFAGDLSAFPRRQPIPLVAPRPQRTRAQARTRLGLESGARIVLLTFGGIGMAGFTLAGLGRLAEFTFIATEGEDAPANVRMLDTAALGREGLDYVDLVAASDVVITKPGYGIVSETIACRTRMVYTDRGDFPEYPVLVEGMTPWLPAVHVSNADLRAARLRAPLEAALALPFPDPPRMDGAEVAAARLLEAAGE